MKLRLTDEITKELTTIDEDGELPKLGNTGVSSEFIFDGFGLDDPLIARALAVLMNQFGGFVVVNRVNFIVGVVNIRTLNFEALNEHFA